MGGTNTFGYLALVAFATSVLVCFATLESRKAVLVCLLGGWLILPVSKVYASTPPFKDKSSFICGVIIVASLFFDSSRWRRIRPHALDFPVTALSLLPFLVALSNDMGVNEALSATVQGITTFGIPYLVGRVYFSTHASLRRFASATVIAALVLIPFMLFEIRMSPNLHYWVYGFAPSQFAQSVRSGGYRPVVFMSHGLMLSLFFAASTVTAYWLWRTRAIRSSFFGIRYGWVVAVLAAMSLLLRSAGAQLLLAVGIATLEATRLIRSTVLVVVLLVTPPAYCAARIYGWNATEFVALLSGTVGLERADSFDFRVRNETLLIDKAMQRPILGWGRWGRSRVYDEEGRDVAITDGFWIIVLGGSGIAGLIALGLTFQLPVLALLRRYPARFWDHPTFAPVAALAIGLLLFTMDSVPNAMLSPLFLVSAGAITGFCLATDRVRARRHAARILEPAPAIAPGVVSMKSDPGLRASGGSPRARKA